MVAVGLTGSAVGCEGGLSEAASVISGVAVDGGGGGCTGAMGVVDVGGGCTGSLEVVDVGGCAGGVEVVDAGGCAVGTEVVDVCGSKAWGCMAAIGSGNGKGWEDFLLDLAAFWSLSFLASTTSGGLPSLIHAVLGVLFKPGHQVPKVIQQLWEVIAGYGLPLALTTCIVPHLERKSGGVVQDLTQGREGTPQTGGDCCGRQDQHEVHPVPVDDLT